MASWSLRFGTQRVLGVTRFDRQWMGADEAAVSARGYVPNPSSWIARLPQEDLCQASGLPPIQKYEADGGPSIEDVLQILAGSESPEVDRADFVLAQLAFWLLAATETRTRRAADRATGGDAARVAPGRRAEPCCAGSEARSIPGALTSIASIATGRATDASAAERPSAI